MATNEHDMDIFEREQSIFDAAVRHNNRIKNGEPFDVSEFETLTKEYGKLLKQLRRVTKISDRATDNLNASKLELLDKVHFDVLTGIYNRRYLDETMKRNIKGLSRSGGCISIMMMDVDFFKKYNDTYGHSEGDECLKAVAKTIANSITRADDYASRYGGEEFVVVLPNTEESGARVIANRILENIRALNIPHEKNEATRCVTISIGLTTIPLVDYIHTSEDYIKRADEALYQSKNSGRNRYTFISFEEDNKDEL